MNPSFTQILDKLVEEIKNADEASRPKLIEDYGRLLQFFQVHHAIANADKQATTPPPQS